MSFIGLLAAVIVCFLVFAGFQAYFKPLKPQIVNQIIEAAPAQAQTFDTSSYPSSLDSIKKQLDVATHKEMERARDMEEGRY